LRKSSRKGHDGKLKQNALTESTSVAANPEKEGSQRDILEIALEEFASNGLAGARVDAIAERTKTSKRMIYYHFESKEGLYLAVLEKVYQDIRNHESKLNLLTLQPEASIRRLIDSTFDYDQTHPDFIRMVSVENIHNGKYIAGSLSIGSQSSSIIEMISEILKRGRKDGVFRSTIEAVDLHLMISAFCFFRVSNSHTFGAIFKIDLNNHKLRKRHKKLIGDTIITFLKTPDVQGDG
jgi:AcrR family transcriptional regulator